MSKTNRTIAIIDIGSASVGGAIVELPKTNINQKKVCPIIKYSLREPITLTDQIGFKTFIKEIFEALDKILEKIKAEKSSFDECLVFLSSPFYLSQTKIIRVKKNEPFLVTKKFVDQLLAEENHKLLQNHPRLYPDLLADTTAVLENIIMQSKLNGYETSNIHNRKTNDLILAQYLSIVSKQLADKFNELIRRRLKVKKISFCSLALGVSSIVRDIGGHRNFLILDVSGELTDLIIATDGYLAENISFPHGRNFIIRGLAERLSASKETAYSELKMYKMGQLDENRKEKIKSALDDLKKDWLIGLAKALNTAMESIILPKLAFIVGDDVLAEIFADWMADQSLLEFSLANQPIEFKLLRNKELGDYCLDQSGERIDPFFQIEGLFAEKVL